jgi:Cu+-exporting ATPase
MSETKTVTKDPVCGMTVDPTTSLHTNRDGKAFYFCSDQCQKKFDSLSSGQSKTCCG